MTQEATERAIADRINAYWLERGHSAGAKVTEDQKPVAKSSGLCVRSALIAGLPEHYELANGQASLAVANGTAQHAGDPAGE